VTSTEEALALLRSATFAEAAAVTAG